MKKYPKLIFVFIFQLILVGCLENNEVSEKTDTDGWIKETKVSKLIKNVNFVFPESGYAFDYKEDFIKKALEAIEHNKNILQKNEFNDTIYVRVMSSRDEMFIYTGTRAGGNAYPYWSTVNIVLNEDETDPPIKHELMHLMAMLDWDYARSNIVWVNEGIATYAANNCNGYNVAEIYRYLLAEDKLISMEDLSADFYGQSEMVGYHQSGYIVQYLLENYSLKKFERLWTDGFERFEEIYGVSYQKMKNDLEETLVEKYPEAPKIDWEKFSKGCK
ncbi:peptidase MA family metallohydrolase [Muricauda sp. MAR_2010_75]|uniref:peptidase MA family metallohydrolase n=1 Tax=Allomuricauda sp. MAR_2010_75 TaxID=1250232 RepID=UPI00056C65A9|nr:peptidase MA family metallohydrolase [Muricauda sp. MAR_2010_75]